MKFYRPGTVETDKRRKLIEDLIRTRSIKDVPHMYNILTMEYDVTVTEETIRKDFLNLNAAKDPSTGTYTFLDTIITRFDLYLMLRHSCLWLLNDMRINKAGDTIFLYPDIGVAGRFEYILEAIRQDERITTERSWHDNILGVVSGMDVVVVHFADGEAGRKFYRKIQYLAKQHKELDWVESFDEESLMRKVMSHDDVS